MRSNTMHASNFNKWNSMQVKYRSRDDHNNFLNYTTKAANDCPVISKNHCILFHI